MVHIPHVAYTAVVVGAVFIQMAQAAVYGPLFGELWIAAMKKDKNGEQWMNKDKNKSDMSTRFLNGFLLNLVKAWTTGLLLNLTQAATVSQAAQLGMFLFIGATAPNITSEAIWEKRGMDLQRFKYLTGFTSTVMLSCLMYLIGTA